VRRRTFALCLTVLFAAGPAAAQPPIREIGIPGIDYPAGVTPGPVDYRVRVRYELGPDGHIADCAVARGSGQPLLDAESCRILQARARIRPERGTRRGQLVVVWLNADTLRRPFVRGGPLAFALYQNMTTNDYPMAAVSRQESGTTTYAVNVSATGRPTACRVIESSGSEALDRCTCELVMTRGAYIPAADGPGIAYGRITWRLP
jgi:TonB family protein